VYLRIQARAQRKYCMIMKLLNSIVIPAVIILLTSVPVQASGEDATVTRLAWVINQARITRGLAPYSLNTKLSFASRSHSDDLARNGLSLGHIGSDGSTPLERIDRAGYVRAGGWGGEIWAWADSPETALNKYWQDKEHADMVFNPILREFGVGVTPLQHGYIMVVDFGASPNVLPVFINGGSDVTEDPAVMLTLANEDAIPFGEGPFRIGRATSVIISTRSDFSNAHPIPFSSSVPFRLSDRPGLQSVYVRFIDAQGRASVTTASIELQGPITSTPRPTSARGQAPNPTATTAASIDRSSRQNLLQETASVPGPTVTGQALMGQNAEPTGSSILPERETPSPILDLATQSVETSPTAVPSTAIESLSQIVTLVIILFALSLLLSLRVHFRRP
jgi:hypothetical protein